MNYNPYFSNQNMNQSNQYANQFYNPQFMQQPRIQPQDNFQIQPAYRPAASLQGKSVDNIEVVKATDIPLDGSISYFPIVDGSAIVTKQLQPDGTSRIIIYKPVDDTDIEETVKFVTVEELNDKIKEFDVTNELKSIKRQLSDMQEDIEDMHKKIKK